MTFPSSPTGLASSRSHRLFPTLQSGYKVNGKFSLCVPVGTDLTNGVANPSLETNSTGYALSGSAAIARSTLKQRRGAWSLAVTPTAAGFDGAFYATVATVGSTIYTFACDVLGAAGVRYRIFVASTAGNAISGFYEFTATGRWQRVSITYQETAAPSVTTNRRLYLTKAGGTSTAVFYWDGLSNTATAFPVTYFDGDNRGFVPGVTDFYWTGTPQGSASVMSGKTRAGGKLIPLANFGFTLLAVLGLGMTPLNNISIPLAAGGGAFYQTTVEQDRAFDLVGAITGRSLQEVQRRRHDLMQAIKPDNVPFDQPLLLRYTPTDDCGNENGHDLDIVCSYESGLEGNLNNHYQENLDLRFHIYLPFAAREDGWSGASLGYQQSVTNANYILKRASNGLWQALGTAGSGGATGVFAIAIGQDGSIYVGGGFALMGGVPNTRGIAKWDGANWTALGTGLQGTGTCASLAIGQDGSLYCGGAFTTAGGVTNTVNIAKWDGSTWLALGTGANNTVETVYVANDGTLYAGGVFSQMGGVANTAGVAKWNGTAWSALGTGIAGGSALGAAITTGADGSIYIAGNFVTANGVTVNGIAKWTGSTFTALGSGITGGTATGYALAVGPDGLLYLGGNFTAVGGVTASNIASWNGAAWAPLGAGVSGGSFPVYYNCLNWINNQLYISGTFTSAGGLTPPTSQVIWTGSAYVFPDVIYPGSPNVQKVVSDKSGNFYTGFSTTGTATASVVTALTNAGVVKAYPRLTLTGPGTLYQLLNNVTGRAIYFNLTLNAGEIAVLDFSDPQNVQFSSNFRANLLGTILAGSNLDWFLMPGANAITLFVAGSVNINTAAVVAWRNTYHAIDSALNLSVVN